MEIDGDNGMMEEVRQAWRVKLLISGGWDRRVGRCHGGTCHVHQSAAHGIGTHVEKADDRSEVGGMGCGARFRGHRRLHRYRATWHREAIGVENG